MEKLKLHSRDLSNEKYEKLIDLFPNIVTESIDEDGNVIRVIDSEALSREISQVVIGNKDERYQFMWPDKSKSILLSNSIVSDTLRPIRNESVNFDETNNIYIKGDNLTTLKLLRESYLNKVDIIYIDPPYNADADTVYKDEFVMSTNDYLEKSNSVDSDGNRLFKNTSSSGRFHTDWLNMIYPRIKVSRDLLSDSGVIFISIDDHEQENIKKICNEIFGEQNFIAQVVWERAYSPVNLKKHFSASHDYILCYAKNITEANCNGLKRDESANSRYSNRDNDIRGPWKSADLTVGPEIADKIYPIVTPSGRVVYPPSGRCWLYTQERLKEMIEDNRIWFGADGNNVPSVKKFLSEVKNTVTPMTVWHYEDVGHSQDASQKLKKLFDGKSFFEYPKPVDLIKRCIQLYSKKDSIVLDFFSGSATTAEAVTRQNLEDGGSRSFILVQLQEKVKDKSEAYKSGYKNICEIGLDRIKRCYSQIKRESPLEAQNIDLGFRVFEVDSSNMKDVYYEPSAISQLYLDEMDDNYKSDRTSEDLLFQSLLDLGISISSKLTVEYINGVEVFNVENSFLYACFDTNISDKVVEIIAKRKPRYAIFKNSGMLDDSTLVNFDEIFKAVSPETSRRLL